MILKKQRQSFKKLQMLMRFCPTQRNDVYTINREKRVFSNRLKGKELKEQAEWVDISSTSTLMISLEIAVEEALVVTTFIINSSSSKKLYQNILSPQM